MTDTPANPPAGFPATFPGAIGQRSDDPIPPAADLPADPATPPAVERPVSDTDRADFEAWRDQRDADRATRGQADEGEEACPRCGASLTNPAHHENLTYCWRCGFGSAPDQQYPAKAEAPR